MQQFTDKPEVCIVVLNWNGWKDTIACLESLLHLQGVSFSIVLIDNASSDRSIDHVRNWSISQATSSPGLTLVDLTPADLDKEAITNPIGSAKPVLYLICSELNLGFAAGCNMGSRLALKLRADYIWFLNNDTVVEPDALLNQVKYLNSNPDVQATTGQIRYFDKPVIWNCGGMLTRWGSRKYLYHGELVSRVPQSGTCQITFVTGCALLIRSVVFKNLGAFTERFFFGEEDYEFSQRMRQRNLKIVCCFDSVIYHKVGASVSHASDKMVNLWYINYLNRFIDMRSFMPNTIWRVWRYASLAYILPMLKVRYRPPVKTLYLMGRALLRDSTRLDGVSKSHFEHTMRQGFEYQS